MLESQRIMSDAFHQTLNTDSNYISEKDLSERQLMPTVLVELMEVLEKLHPNVNCSCRFNILLAKTAQMVSFKRIMFQELEHKNPKLVNYYAINFMPSGMGKDETSNTIDEYFFKKFRLHFKQKAEDFKKEESQRIQEKANEKFPSGKANARKGSYIVNQKEGIRDLVIEIHNATQEGLFSDAETFDKARFGSPFIKLSEFGKFFQNNRQDDMVFFNSLYEAYDGIIASKATKYDKRKSSIEEMPVNILLHSDPTSFKSSVQEVFYESLQTGFARRAIISFQGNTIKKIEENGLKARKIQEQAYITSQDISEKVICLFLDIPENAVYKLNSEVYDNVFYPYKVKLTKLNNENSKKDDVTDIDLLNKEVNSRELKVLKVAGMYACLNHPKELIINETDIKQAINTVEFMSGDFKKFLRYKPKTHDDYEKLFNFFLDNLEKPFTKTQLVNRYREFGFKRGFFRKEFGEILGGVQEIASEKGYNLVVNEINNNSGNEVTLIKPESREVGEEAL